MGLAEAYAYVIASHGREPVVGDAEEGICAFIDKRDPTWEDR